MDTTNKIAASRAECAAMLGISENTLVREFIRPGLVPEVDLGGRARSILIRDLHAAVDRKAREQIADPTLRKNRSAGAQDAVANVVRNPWGRKGKPREHR